MTGLRKARIAEGLLVAIPLVLWTLVGCEPTTPTASADPQTAELLRKAGEFIAAQKSFKLVVEVEMVLEAQGQKAEVKNSYLLSVERPNRLAMRLKEGDNGVTLVDDGKQFWRAIPALKKYVVGDAPSSMAEVFKDKSAAILGMGIGGAFFNGLLSEHPYDALTGRVAETRDLGIEEIDGKPCQHLRFEQLEYDWDAWIETGARPLVSKVAFNVKKLPGSGEQMPNVKLELVYGLHDWDLDPKFGDDEFVFNPPADWQKVDDLFGGGSGEEEEPPHPLLGKPAPDFELEKRGGGKVKLASFRDKDVVILDFWATWCGPCVRALPTIAKVAEKYRDRGVAFYAVDLAETPAEVEEFLKEQKLDIPVLFDSDSAVAKLYGVSGIPQTVLIGKDGTVQVVHVGLKPDLEKRLSGELDDLLAGKNLAAESRASSQKAQGDVEGMKQAWSRDGSWSGVAAAGEDAVYGLERGGKIVKTDAKGDNLAEATIEDSAPLLRVANLDGDKTPELLTFQVWGPTVKAHSAEGKPLWSYEEGQGVDDVWAADLNGDGRDEVIIGYNGGTGLHVLDSAGKLLWKNTELGNVWHVTAGNVEGDDRPEVITTSAEGKVHIFDGEGKPLRDLNPGIYSSMVRTCPSGGDDKAPDLIVVGGKGAEKEEVVAMDAEGNNRWSLPIPTNLASAAGCRTKPWIALAVADGTVQIVDASTGKEIAHASAQGKQAEVTWLPVAGGDPLAVVATGRSLTAFAISAEKP